MVSNTSDLIYKVLLLGDSSVGKTCFLLRFTEDTYTDNHISTIGVDYKLKLYQNENQTVKIQIWDTAGQDRFRSITKNYFRGSHGIMLIYDITSLTSFNNIKTWILQIRESLGDQASIILIGNKVDLESSRKVNSEEGFKLANQNKMGFYETSAKEDINMQKAFDFLCKEMIKKSDGHRRETILELNDKKKKCC